MNQDNIDLAIKNVQSFILQNHRDLSGGEKLTKVVIERIEKSEEYFQDIATTEQRDFIIRKVFSNLSRTMEDGVTIVDNTSFEPWYRDIKGEIKSIYWEDYKRYLKVDQDWPDTENGPINGLDSSTDSILENCADPSKKNVIRKGMVVGNVQSGKTANYLGLICKAADAQYKVIIVVAGMLEDLRRQTQIRLEEGLVGVNELTGQKIGCGNLSSRDEKNKPVCVTDREKDFTSNNTDSNLINITNTAPYVIVVKKNSKTLKHLNTWLNKIRRNFDDKKIPVPMLLIDDEADNASIDVRNRRRKDAKTENEKGEKTLDNPFPEENADQFNVTAINRNLRLIIKKFTTCTYIGYTATPFANIFISPKTNDDVLKDDLFPKDFISYLDPANNYFGPQQAFVEPFKYERFIKHINVIETTNGKGITIPHKKDFRLDSVPKSLQDAIKGYIVATTIRWVEGYKNKHSSMLVNASCYSDVQISIANKIKAYVIKVANSLKASAGLDDEKAEKSYTYYKQLKTFWKENFAKDRPKIYWDDLKPLIHIVANKIVVVIVNKEKGVSERLDYDQFPNGRLVIAVGGYSLSRGLTLEGLISSYYLRTSRMYDTILQMARWFGYRDDYEDLCRLYMTKKSEENFTHISKVINHLNNQIKILETQRKTPKDFALYVRSHPDAKRLMVTSRPKLGSAELVKITLTYAGKLVGNYLIPKEINDIEFNRKQSFEFIEKLSKKYSESLLGPNINQDLSSKYAFRNIPFKEIFELTEKHIVSSDNVQIDLPSFLTYLKERENELRNWDVIIDTNSYKKQLGFEIGGLNINPANRLTRVDERFISNTKSITTTVGQNSTILSNDIANVTASKEEIDKAKKKIDEFKGKLGLAKAISLVTARPILYITIYRIKLEEIREEQPFYDQYKEFYEFSKNLDVYASLSYRLPETGLIEEPKEVWKNADIDTIGEDYDDGDD
tara:strand:+ start:41 stop:2911 length:2871 start_codon:yes stop_codon:yes gene_type:complete